jgi:hypothetical protein
VAFLVSLTVRPAQGGASRKVLVHLPANPEPGELIELPDGTRVVVDEVKPSARAGIDAEVDATRHS